MIQMPPSLNESFPSFPPKWGSMTFSQWVSISLPWVSISTVTRNLLQITVDGKKETCLLKKKKKVKKSN